MYEQIRNAFAGFFRGGVEKLPRAAAIIVLIALVHILIKVMLLKTERFLVGRIAATDKDTLEFEKQLLTSLNILNKVIYAGIWILGILILVADLGIDMTPFMAAAGIFGVAIAVGSQSLVKDFVNGVFIIFENQIRVGDVASINGTFGVVETVKLRTVSLRDISGAVHYFSNSNIRSVSNLTKEWSGFVFDIGVAIKEDTDRVIEVLSEVAKSIEDDPELGPKLRGPVEIFGLDKINESALIVKGRIRTDAHEHKKTGREFLRRVKQAFDREGIEIPFPHKTLYFGSESVPVDVKLKK